MEIDRKELTGVSSLLCGNKNMANEEGIADSILRGLSDTVALRPSLVARSRMEEAILLAATRQQQNHPLRVSNSDGDLENNLNLNRNCKGGSVSYTDSTVASTQDVDEEISWSSFVSLGSSSAGGGYGNKNDDSTELCFPAELIFSAKKHRILDTSAAESLVAVSSSMCDPTESSSKLAGGRVNSIRRTRQSDEGMVASSSPPPPTYENSQNGQPHQLSRIRLDSLPPPVLSDPTRHTYAHHHVQQQLQQQQQLSGTLRCAGNYYTDDDIFGMFQWSASPQGAHYTVGSTDIQGNNNIEDDHSFAGSSANPPSLSLEPLKQPSNSNFAGSGGPLNNNNNGGFCDSDSVSTIRVSNTRLSRSHSFSSLRGARGTANNNKNSQDTVTTTPSETSSQRKAYCRDAAAKDKAVQLSAFDAITGQMDPSVHALQFGPSNSATIKALSARNSGGKPNRPGWVGGAKGRGTTILRRFAPNLSSGRSNKAASSSTSATTTATTATATTALNSAAAALSTSASTFTNNSTSTPSSTSRNELATPDFFKDYQAYSRVMGTSSSNLSSGGDITDSSNSNNRSSSDSSCNDGPRKLRLSPSDSNNAPIQQRQQQKQQQQPPPLQQTNNGRPRRRSSLNTSSLYHPNHRRRSSLDSKQQQPKTSSTTTNKGGTRKTVRSSKGSTSLNNNNKNPVKNEDDPAATLAAVAVAAALGTSPRNNNNNSNGILIKSSNRRRSLGATSA